jgi:hypothetical protein
MSLWKSLFWMLLLTAIPVMAQTDESTNCCRFPVRGFGAVNVTLTPLFTWWSRQEAALTNGNILSYSGRPMPAWKRIVGIHAGDSPYGWFVDAEVFTNVAHGLKGRIVLQNPPVQEEQQFYALKQQIAGYELQITNAQQEYKEDVKTAKRDEKLAKTQGRSWKWNEQVIAKNNAAESAQKHDAAQKAQTMQAQAKQSIQVAEQQLTTIPSEHGRYKIDYFALETGKYLNGLPIYDVGVIYSGR